MRQKEIVFDIETDGLLNDMSLIHCLAIQESDKVRGYHGSTLSQGLDVLSDDVTLIGHNIINFDLPAIQKINPEFTINPENIIDTLIVSRLVYPDLKERDFKLVRLGRLPANLIGKHSLEAWGYRLGMHKGDYKKEMEARGIDPWKKWNPDMQAYCENDVKVNALLWKKLQERGIPEKALRLETWFAFIMSKQEQAGFCFDKRKAVSLYEKLYKRREKIDKRLTEIFHPCYEKVRLFTPKISSKKTGYVKGCTLTQIKLTPFNPASRKQIAVRLIREYGWKPEIMTEGGQPQIDESVLATLHYTPCELLAERFMVEKRIGQLAEGKNAWLKLELNGKIHGRINTIGAVTGRCTHSRPNIAQVPSIKTHYGKECRELFHVPEGYVQIGADASGLELRCLAHYMGRYDGGEYGKNIIEGDIHTVNQKAAGLATRDQAKTFIYGFLYGAGDAKIGQIIGKGEKTGRALKRQFLSKTPALKRLREDVINTVKTRKYLLGIDGRVLYIRSEHAALNTLLQSAGALLVKQATINLYKMMLDSGYKWGSDWAIIAHIHDEMQIQVRKGLETVVSEFAKTAFVKAGEQFNWRCPLAGEIKTGKNWAECH